jgi:hypothetical protein
MRREVALAGFETRGKRFEGLVESSKVPSGWEGDGGMRLAVLDARRLAPGLFDNRWSKQGSGRGTLLCSHLDSRRPRFRSPAAGTGVRRRPAISSEPWVLRSRSGGFKAGR